VICAALGGPNGVANVQPGALQLKSNNTERFGIRLAVDQIGTAGQIVGELPGGLG
jgi:hypothetical protein